MKLRYYMRGLGIGILVTAVLMSVTINGKTEKLTDDEIIARAEALGMVQEYEDVVLADTVSDNQAEKETAVVTVPDVEAKQEEDDEKNQQPDENETVVQEEEETEEEPKEEETPIKEIETDQTVEIVVQGGDGSQTVAKKLLQAGLVDDAQAYDRYLCTNGYDKRICTGTHRIPVGAGDEEIAAILTTRPN
nr:hypothetical protein [Lachnospiraceae bacterium]